MTKQRFVNVKQSMFHSRYTIAYVLANASSEGVQLLYSTRPATESVAQNNNSAKRATKPTIRRTFL